MMNTLTTPTATSLRDRKATLSAAELAEQSRALSHQRRRRIGILGHFGLGNLGNNATLRSFLYHVRQFAPDADLTCICNGPQDVAATYKIDTRYVTGAVVKPWKLDNAIAKLTRKVLIGIPSELYRWLKCFKTLRSFDALFIPGTGLLTDAHGLMSDAGPYSVFRWSLAAKLSGCRLLFVSVGAGPVYGRLGRLFVKWTLGLADYRSYRDIETQECLRSIGFVKRDDRVYPDLVFSLPNAIMPHGPVRTGGRQTVAIGLMEYAGRYSSESNTTAIYDNYLESMALFVRWLTANRYQVRLLIGDTGDMPTVERFKDLLDERLPVESRKRIIDEPARSIDDLLSQFVSTDIAVATRFHNVLSALLLNTPVIGISFHPKVSSLLRQMDLSEYCVDIRDVSGDVLMDRFSLLRDNADSAKRKIRERVKLCRRELDEQYRILFADIS